MIGIYQDSFVDYLQENLGDPIKIKSKNIVCRCPWCEFGKEKSHYHCYISLELPIWHCFHGGCERGGNLKKLLKKIEGSDITDRFVDKEKIKVEKKFFDYKEKETKVRVPSLQENIFSYKSSYMRKRLKFANVDLKNINGLVFNINGFLNLNNIAINPTLFRIKDYLHSNFVGFLTKHSSLLMLRNVDHKSDFPFFKLEINSHHFLDYYQLDGGNPNSNKFVLGEGIFDIFSEQIFDSLKLKNSVRSYASVLSSKYSSLIKSLVFYEQVFRPDIVILSDNGIGLEYYRKLKKFNKHIINSLNIYYNKRGKDFGEKIIEPEKFVI